MKPCLVSMGLAAALCLAAPSAAAQDSVTLTTSGNLLYVSDGLGLFGNPGTTRQDVSFSMSITLDLDTLRISAGSGSTSFFPVDALPAQASGFATIDGQTWRWSVESPDVQGFLTRGGNGASMSARGMDAASGFEVYAREVLEPEEGTPQFVRSGDYRDTVEFDGVRNRVEDNGAWLPPAYFSVTGMMACATCPGGMMQANTSFVANDPVFARWSVSPVPEPSAWLMLAGGLGLLAAARRTRLLASARTISRS